MAKGGGRRSSPGHVYLPEWCRLYDCMKKILREEHARAEELSAKCAHLAAELEFVRTGRLERDEIFKIRIQQIRRDEERRRRVEKAETAVLVGDKDLESRCYQKLAELADSDVEDLRSCFCTVAAKNSELKAKLKEFENQAELNENNVDHQHSAKDLRLELRKLKQAYKNLSSEKDKKISALTAEKDFAWKQFETMEQEYIVTIKNKKIEAKQATEAAQKLQQNVDELQAAGQKKDAEIVRLQADVTNAKEKMQILEDQLKQMHSKVKSKDVETDKNKDDQPETSRKSKKDINGTNRKSKSEGPVLKKNSRTSQVTPDRRDVKTSRTRASETNQKRKRGSSLRASETSQERKRGSSLSCGSRRCSTRVLQDKAAVSPMLLPPSFTVPKLKTPTPP